MKEPVQVPYQIASNTTTGAACLLVPDRPGRGTPERARLLGGVIHWTAADDLIEQVGGPLPDTLVGRIESEGELLVVPIGESGLPASDFVLAFA